MARPINSPSGEARITTTVRIDPNLKAWAQSQKWSLSTLLEKAIVGEIKEAGMEIVKADSGRWYARNAFPSIAPGRWHEITVHLGEEHSSEFCRSTQGHGDLYEWQSGAESARGGLRNFSGWEKYPELLGGGAILVHDDGANFSSTRSPEYVIQNG